MNKITSKLKQSFAIFLIFTLIFAMFPGAVGAEETDETKDYGALVDEAIENAILYINEKGTESEWEAIAISRAGHKVPESYKEVFHNNIENQVTNPGRLKITDIERLAMAAQVIDLDPRDIEGVNLIEEIYNTENFTNDWVDEDYMTRQGNNGPIFALIAFDSGGYSIPDDARWTREKLVDYLLEQQLDSGGWPLSGPNENIDITSMAIIALSNYQDKPKVEEAINKAVSYLSAEQGEEGGFDVAFHGGISSESTSQAIIGLTSAGLDPLGEDFTKNGNNLISHLLTFATEDGGFKHVPGDKTSNSMGTEQALQALVAYKLYLNNDGKLYDFEKREDPEPQPDPEPTPDPGEEVAEVEVGKKTNITSTGQVRVKGSKTKIVLPEGLPEDTKLTINESNEQKTPYKESKLDLAGDWYEFVFEGNEGFDATYELTLGVDDTAKIDNADIYHFNEENQEWELVESTMDYENHTLTVTVEHFSVYGVFTKNVTEDKENDTIEQPDSENEDDREGNNDNKKQSEENDEGDVSNDKGTKDDEPKKDNHLTTVSKQNENEDKNNHLTTTQNTNKDGKKLPETATNTYNFMLIGILILSLGLILFGVRMRIATNNNR